MYFYIILSLILILLAFIEENKVNVVVGTRNLLNVKKVRCMSVIIVGAAIVLRATTVGGDLINYKTLYFYYFVL